MPEPSEYENEADWMAACVPTRTEEGDEQDQAVAVCLSMWRERENKSTTATDDVQTDTTTPDEGNALKAVSRTDDELRVGNYIVVFGGRDLEGVASPQVNPDGSRGEYFSANTDLESAHTKSGVVFVDWEHGQDTDPGPGDVLGVVDWKTAKRDERGVWVERVLNRRSKYVKWLESLIEKGLIGTSSEAVPGEIEKSADGHIIRWPLRRDTLTVQPMEPRMIAENHLQAAFKALGIPVPNDTEPEATPEPEPEASPEADTSAADVATARARLLKIRLSLLEE